MKKTRYIPEGYKEYKASHWNSWFLGDYPKDLFTAYIRTEPFISAMFFVGKQSKPAWHYRFKDLDSMKKEVNDHISRLMSWEDMKLKRKEERKNALLDVKVGDLFCSSWGYEQTNVDFYQCVAVKGKTFTIKSICGRSVPGSEGDYNGMADQVVAVKDSFIEDSNHPTLTKRSFALTSYSWLSKTTEQEKHYRSWYA